LIKSNKINSEIIKVDKKYPIIFSCIFLSYIYIFQYPLSLLMRMDILDSQYAWNEWFFAYSFIISSVSIFFLFLIIGMSGTPIVIYNSIKPFYRFSRIRFIYVLAIFAVFFLWSYVMLKLKIGMTIYTDFEPLAFKLAGLLFYGRLFIQPVILAYIANSYSSSRLKNLILVLIFGIGAWASLTSGSRFIGIMFSLPLIYLSSGGKRYILFGLVVATHITIATLSRYFYLPFQINIDYIIEIFGNEKIQTSSLENLYLLPIEYIISRSMGILEVLMTLNFGAITPTFFDSVLNLFAYFLPFIPQGMSVSVKNIYGLDDTAFGGYGLDFFSNYWLFFGGYLTTYSVGIALSAWFLGRTYRLFIIGLNRLGFKEGSMLVFILLFILIFEGRAFLFPWLLMAGWLFSRKIIPRILFSVIKNFHLLFLFMAKNSGRIHKSAILTNPEKK
jgi:hypothetical protein